MSQPDDIEELLGRVWCERYQLLEYIGRGGMGAVFKARQVHMGREVALKVIHRRLCQDEKQIQRFEQEARTSSKLNHPNSIRVFDYGTSDDGRLFMAMEFLKGKTLGQLITDEGTLHPDRVAHIARQMFKSLAEAHELGLVHRDLKPENIFICEIFGETDFVKVLDFGIAKAIGPTEEDAKLTQTGFICGTPRYLSPEQALGQAVDGRADLYSVGVLMYEMLTGRPPFIGENPISIVMKHVHDDPPPIVGVDRHGENARKLLWLIDRLLEKNPARRPAPAEQIVAYLDGRVSQAELSRQLGAAGLGDGGARSLRKLGSMADVPGRHDVKGAVPRSAFRDFGADSNVTTSKRAVVGREEREPTPVPQPPPLPRDAMAGRPGAQQGAAGSSVAQSGPNMEAKRSAMSAIPESDETALIARPASLQPHGDTRPDETQQIQSAKETRLISQEAIASASREIEASQSARSDRPPAPRAAPAKSSAPPKRVDESRRAPGAHKSLEGPLWAWALAGVAIAVMVLSVFTYTWSSNKKAAKSVDRGVTEVVAEGVGNQGEVTGRAIAAASSAGNTKSAQEAPLSAKSAPQAEAETLVLGEKEESKAGSTIGALLVGLDIPKEEAPAADVAPSRLRTEAMIERELRIEELKLAKEAAAAERKARDAAQKEAAERAAEERARSRAEARAERAEKRALKRERSKVLKAERAAKAAEAKAARVEKAEAARAERERKRIEREFEREAAKMERARSRAAKAAAAKERAAAKKEAEAIRRADAAAKKEKAEAAAKKRRAEAAAKKRKAEAEAKKKASSRQERAKSRTKTKKTKPAPPAGDPFEPF